MEYVIKSYEGLGSIRLGMTKEEVRAVMHDEPADYHYFRGPYTDVFEKAGIYVYYTAENGVCEAIEFVLPTVGVLDGKPINKVPYFEVKKWLKQLDNELVEEAFLGAKSYKLGISLYAPEAYAEGQEDWLTEAVMVFRKGYYDILNK
jgi:hypothetical protein